MPVSVSTEEDFTEEIDDTNGSFDNTMWKSSQQNLAITVMK